MTVDVSTDGRVVIISINRPQVRNAVNESTAVALCDAFEDFDANNELDVAVLVGAQGTFCAGADLKAVAQGGGNKVRPEGRGPMGPTRLHLSKPVIAAVEGYAVAGGLELALWCDMRVASRDAVFGVFCRRWGVPLIDGGTLRLPRLIGQSHAIDLILTGRGVSGAEALSMGLANRITEKGAALSTAITLAQQLSAFPQLCLRADRRSAYDQWGLSENEAITNETVRGITVLKSGEAISGAARFTEGAGRHGKFQ